MRVLTLLWKLHSTPVSVLTLWPENQPKSVAFCGGGLGARLYSEQHKLDLPSWEKLCKTFALDLFQNDWGLTPENRASSKLTAGWSSVQVSQFFDTPHGCGKQTFLAPRPYMAHESQSSQGWISLRTGCVPWPAYVLVLPRKWLTIFFFFSFLFPPQKKRQSLLGRERVRVHEKKGLAIY